MSDIYQSIAQKVAEWKTIFKDNVENVTGQSVPRDAANMSWAQIMQITEGTDYVSYNISHPILSGFTKVGTFNNAEQNILHTPAYKYLTHTVMPYISQQATANALICSTPELDDSLAGIVLHNLGNIKMLEMFYETSNKALIKLPDTLIINDGYLATIKAVKNLEDIKPLKEPAQDYKKLCSQEIPF